MTNNIYAKIKDIYTFNTVLDYLKTIKDKSKISVWLDFDDNIINVDNDTIIEPEATKKLIDYMTKNRIFYCVITGRFHDTSCSDKKRNVFDMQYNIINTMYPTMRQLGIPVDNFNTDKHKQTVYKIYNLNKRCVGILYMGIFFSGEKGATIENYLRQTGLKLPIKIFVDDYEPYLTEAVRNCPNLIAFRRHYPY